MTYNSMHEFHCWHHYQTEGKILSVAVLPNGTGPDRLYLIVEREEEGETGPKNKRCIEVIREDGPYMDHDHCDYTSTLLTTALTSVDAKVQKVPIAAVQIYLAEEPPVGGIEITCDGERWDKLDRNTPTLPPGWHNLITSAHWDYETLVGLRVRGDRPLRLLVLQVDPNNAPPSSITQSTPA